MRNWVAASGTVSFGASMPELADSHSADDSPTSAQLTVSRLSSFRTTYIAIAVFLILYIFTVRAAEFLLEFHFSQVVAEAIEVDNFFVPPTEQIKAKLDLLVKRSLWVTLWDVQVNVIVLARDGTTWLYVDGHAPPPSPGISTQAVLRETERLLPATGDVVVSVPHNALLSNFILVFYAALLFQILYLYNRSIARKETQILTQALDLRDDAARKAENIEDEIEAIRLQLLAVEPSEREYRDEIESLQSERESLENQLGSLASRELELRSKAERAGELEQERRALEDLLEEASSDLSSKDGEIHELERSLKRANRAAGASGSRAKESEVIAKRLRTLYKNLEIDERAIEDFVGLRDENTKLRSEECLKRLSEEAENVAIRRKVGGLPNHLSIYELGFAGKRRIYYCKGLQRRFRVLVIGAKNTQQSDLDYISRIPKNEGAG
jgi:hypothetical protein